MESIINTTTNMGISDRMYAISTMLKVIDMSNEGDLYDEAKTMAMKKVIELLQF
jgi:ketol-acid reductoisomerase